MPTGPGVRRQDSCEKPSCSESASKTYRGPHGNRLRLCPTHYYRLVTDGRSETDPLGLGTDPVIRGTTGVGVPKEELGRIPKPRQSPDLGPDPSEIENTWSDSGELLTGGDGSADVRPE